MQCSERDGQYRSVFQVMGEALQPGICVPLLGLWDTVKELGLSVGDMLIPESFSAGSACVSSYPFWGARGCPLGPLVGSSPHC